MSDYNKSTNFTTKDTLPSGNSQKLVKGTELDIEFTNIASAIVSKANSDSPSFTGVPTTPTAGLGTNTTQIASCAFAIANGVPSGCILLWSGAISAIPTGWVLCNGASGTPDLRDRFVVGAGTSYAVGATGGANSVTLDASMIPSHTHSVSASGTTGGHSNDHSHSGTTSAASTDHSHTFAANTGTMSANNTHNHYGTTGSMNRNNPHSHGIGGREYGGGGNPGGDLNGPNLDFGYRTYNTDINHEHDFSTSTVDINHVHYVAGTTSGMSANHTHTVTTGGVSANHTHDVTVYGTSGATGGSAAHENRPPYYALAYIMKS